MNIYTRLFITLVCLSGVLSIPRAFAEEDLETQSKFFLQLQKDWGQNTVLRDETGDSDEDFDFGDGTAIAFGYEFYNTMAWKVRLSLGYKQSSAEPAFLDPSGTVRNKATFETYPLELLLVYDQGWIEYGFGVTYHIEPRMSQSISLDSVPIATQPDDLEFDSQYGIVLQSELDLFEHFAVGLKYTIISYGLQETAGGTLINGQTGESFDNIDADYVSVYMILKF